MQNKLTDQSDVSDSGENRDDDSEVLIWLFQLRDENGQDRLHVGTNQLRSLGDEVAQHPAALLLVTIHTTVLQLSQVLQCIQTVLSYCTIQYSPANIHVNLR